MKLRRVFRDTVTDANRNRTIREPNRGTETSRHTSRKQHDTARGMVAQVAPPRWLHLLPADRESCESGVSPRLKHTDRENPARPRPRETRNMMSGPHARVYHAVRAQELHKSEQLHVRSRTRRELGVHSARSRSASVFVLGTTPGLGPRPPLLDHALAHDAPQPSTRRSS